MLFTNIVVHPSAWSTSNRQCERKKAPQTPRLPPYPYKYTYIRNDGVEQKSRIRIDKIKQNDRTLIQRVLIWFRKTIKSCVCDCGTEAVKRPPENRAAEDIHRPSIYVCSRRKRANWTKKTIMGTLKSKSEYWWFYMICFAWRRVVSGGETASAEEKFPISKHITHIHKQLPA